MKQYQKIWLVVAGLLCLAGVDGNTSFSTVQGASGSQYSVYEGKKSRFCRFMRAARCATLPGFMRYLKAGCVNDTDRESKCLQTFCLKNCAGYSCPSPDSETGRACQQHCRFVNLRNAAAQQRLGRCVTGAYDSSQAASKEAGRTFDRAQLRAVQGQQRGADREARRIVSDLQKNIRGRDGLFFRARLRRPVSRTLRSWVMAADRAKQYTGNINQINNVLQSGSYPEARKSKATDMVRRSNELAMNFIKMAGNLNRHAEELMQNLRNVGSTGAPRSQAQMAKSKEAFSGAMQASAPSFEDLPPPPAELLTPDPEVSLPPPYTPRQQ